MPATPPPPAPPNTALPTTTLPTTAPIPNVSTSQLEYLVAAIDHDTWGAAADSVGVTLSALSQGIAELERRLGIRLFDKQGRRRIPTTNANVAYGHAQRVLAELRELGRWASEVQSGSTGSLSIGMIDTAAIHHFGETLTAFGASNTGVTLRLVVQPSNQLLSMIRSGQLDAAVVVDPNDDPQLVLRPLISEPLHVYAPPGSTIGSPATWGPWVGFPKDSRTRRMIAARLRRDDVDYDVIAESSQPAVLREMVRLGMGWCALPLSDAESEPNPLRRARAEPLASRMLTLATRADRTASPALHALLQALVTHASADPVIPRQ